ncbi:MAG TPA: hypothetical protein VJY31_07730 [Buttiauxella sp.]|nr:hypothetical protein [Buttiauxella sp.]
MKRKLLLSAYSHTNGPGDIGPVCGEFASGEHRLIRRGFQKGRDHKIDESPGLGWYGPGALKIQKQITGMMVPVSMLPGHPFCKSHCA